MPSSQRAYDFSLHPKLSISSGQVGPEREPVVFIDDVLRNPQALVEYACREVEFIPAWSDAGGYPGVRAPAPLNYVESMVQALTPILEHAFPLDGARLSHATCHLSLVTLRPDELTPMQRIPHVDTVDPWRIAILHYLCDETFGGTAFYRHRETGLQTIGQENEALYLQARDLELEHDPPPRGYLQGDSGCYQQTALVEARFNRVVIYRSRHLHCGRIPPGMTFSAEPAAGRLTANIFASFRPA